MSKYKTSEYLKADDIGPDEKLVTITGVKEEECSDFKGGTHVRPFLRFKEIEDKALEVRSMNLTTLMELFGEESDNWVGKKIYLHVVTTAVGDSVQVKKKKYVGATQAAAPVASGWQPALGAWKNANPAITDPSEQKLRFSDSAKAFFKVDDLKSVAPFDWNTFTDHLKQQNDIPF